MLHEKGRKQYSVNRLLPKSGTGQTIHANINQINFNPSPAGSDGVGRAKNTIEGFPIRDWPGTRFVTSVPFLRLKPLYQATKCLKLSRIYSKLAE